MRAVLGATSATLGCLESSSLTIGHPSALTHARLPGTKRALQLAVFGVTAYASPAVAVIPGFRYPFILTRLRPRTSDVVLTFDDGPHPEATPAILECLDDLGLGATFFVVGEQVVRYPEILRDIEAAGHEVGLHGYRHLPHALLPPNLVLRDLEHGQATLDRVLGHPVRTMRAPFGTASLATLAYARRRGLLIAGWSRWGWDWSARATPESVAHAVTCGVVAGDVLLLHDSDAYAVRGSWRQTLRSLPMIAGSLRARGLGAQSLSDVLALVP
jgi:peptidoglycan/xylan/chitin deacetylase (PgdA/CDA1 family)